MLTKYMHMENNFRLANISDGSARLAMPSLWKLTVYHLLQGRKNIQDKFSQLLQHEIAYREQVSLSLVCHTNVLPSLGDHSGWCHQVKEKSGGRAQLQVCTLPGNALPLLQKRPSSPSHPPLRALETAAAQGKDHLGPYFTGLFCEHFPPVHFKMSLPAEELVQLGT